jgi:hypothetical protein
VAELGSDMKAFASGKNFTSWPGLTPGKGFSGGVVISKGKRKVKNRVAAAFAHGGHNAVEKRQLPRRAVPASQTAIAVEKGGSQSLAKLTSLASAKGFQLIPIAQAS